MGLIVSIRESKCLFCTIGRAEQNELKIQELQLAFRRSGPALALINAIALHQALLGMRPKPVSFKVVAPIYSSTSGLVEGIRAAEDPPPLATTPRSIEYSAESLQRVLHSLYSGSSSKLSIRAGVLTHAA